MAYETEHASALADVQAAGFAVTFTETKPGTSDPETGLFTTPASSTIAGQAIQDGGNPETYKRLGLDPGEAPSLFFVPTTKGQTPALGSSVTWNSIVYAVKSVLPLAPDGSAIAATVVVAR